MTEAIYFLLDSHDRQKEGTTAPAEASRAASQQSRAAAEKRQRLIRSVEPPRVLIDEPPASVAVHPSSDELAAGTQVRIQGFAGLVRVCFRVSLLVGFEKWSRIVIDEPPASVAVHSQREPR